MIQPKYTEGILLAKNQSLPFPLKKTEVNVNVVGMTTKVEVLQRFENPYDVSIEAIYVFPLSHRAAVYDFEMKVGERVICGEVKEREEARRKYQEALRERKRASLLEQERPNIFTVSVANIVPREEIVVNVKYFETLEYRNGAYHFVFPMVVEPRYCPNGKVSPEVVDRDRITPPVLPPEVRSGNTISLNVQIEAGDEIAGVESPSHEVDVEKNGPGRAKVSLRGQQAIPNKDFVLVYRTRAEELRFAFWTSRTKGRPGFFLALLSPPEYREKLEFCNKEMIFVLDRSGSMSGTAIDQTKNALKGALQSLHEGDSFTVLFFNHQIEWLSEVPLLVSPESLEKANRHLDAIEARGGTEILPAMREALCIKESKGKLKIVVFLTDGSVGNEERILSEVKEHLGNSRIYTFGIGSSVNRYFLDKMAQIGRGVSEYILPTQSIGDAMRNFQDNVSFPVLTHLSLDWGRQNVVDVYPQSLPDLFVGAPKAVIGRFLGSGQCDITLKGKRAGKEVALSYSMVFPEEENGHELLSLLWARSRIDHLTDMEREDRKCKTRYRDEILSLAIEYHLSSQYTSFVAIDQDSEDRTGFPCVPIHVPGEMPEGMDMPGSSRLGFDGENISVDEISVERKGNASLEVSMFRSEGPQDPRKKDPNTGSPSGERSSRKEKPKMPKSGLVYLARVQNKDGSWGDGNSRNLLTSFAALAFAWAGHTDREGEYLGPMQKTITWIMSRSDEDASQILARHLVMIKMKKYEKPGYPSIEEIRREIKKQKPKNKLEKILKHYCLLEIPSAEEKPEMRCPVPQDKKLGFESYRSLFQTVLICHAMQNKELQGELKKRFELWLATRGEELGSVFLPCGRLPATIGATLFFTMMPAEEGFREKEGK